MSTWAKWSFPKATTPIDLIFEDLTFLGRIKLDFLNFEKGISIDSQSSVTLKDAL